MRAGGDGGMWLDREAGPVVRPYALTRGRTQAQGPALGLIDLVTATGPRAATRAGSGRNTAGCSPCVSGRWRWRM